MVNILRLVRINIICQKKALSLYFLLSFLSFLTKTSQFTIELQAYYIYEQSSTEYAQATVHFHHFVDNT